MADTLSRVYLPDTSIAEMDDDLVQVVHFLITNLRAATTEVKEIQQATDANKALQKVKLYFQKT